jgi:trans-2,3-dihydro-3-hydroxyanthranilate isomerase
MDFYITDVFGQEKYSGNQLATFLHCGGIDAGEMQQIAREINFSETTFVLSEEPTRGGYDVRIFTPGDEVKFGGHPTLGTAFIIREHLICKPVEQVILNLQVGQVPVEIPMEGSDTTLWMHQVEPEFGQPLEAERLARVLNLDRADINEKWPIQQVSTGLPFIIVPLTTLDALKRARLIRDAYRSLIEETWAKLILIFCPEGYSAEQTLAVRVFAEYLGITEDPATGSGNGCLAAYLVKQRYFGTSSIDLRVGQGNEIGRPSLLALRANEEGRHIHVSVGGRVIPVARGQWFSATMH